MSAGEQSTAHALIVALGGTSLHFAYLPVFT